MLLGMWKSSNADQLFQRLTLFPVKLKKIRAAFELQSLKIQPAIPKLMIRLKGRENKQKTPRLSNTDSWNQPSWTFKVKSKLSFPELPFISTQHKASILLPQTPPFLPFWKAERKRNQLTFWTVVVRSKQSWMILFFIDEKSAIPVNGVLQQEKIPFRLEGSAFSHPILPVRKSIWE